MDEVAIGQLKMQHPHLPDNSFQVSPVENLPFADCFFDHIISSAVLHFANNQRHFFAMISEMERVLKPGGTLFVRMATNVGIENLVVLIEDGVYYIPDGSIRFLLTRPLLTILLNDYPFTFIEEVKTVNVNDTRCMMTLLLQKNSISKM